MKKLLILITLISPMIIPSVAYSKWTEVAKSVAGDTFYVDLERIRKHDGKVYYWTLGDYLKPETNGVISAKIYAEAECDRFRYRWLSGTFFRGPMATGEVSSSNNTPDKEWNYPPPNSDSETVLKAVCNHKSMQ